METMEKILFVHTHKLDGSSGGDKRTLQAISGLRNFFDVELYSCYKPENKIKGLLRNLFLYSGMLTKKDSDKILKKISAEKIKTVFLDSSLHGKLAARIKKENPDVKIIVNYHNNEKKYYHDMFRLKGLPYYLVYLSARHNENLSNCYGDFHVFISDEDKASMQVKGKSIIIPVTLEDNFKESEKSPEQKEPYVLFLGSSFFANIEAGKFIIQKIAPFINKKFYIAGSGMKKAFPDEYENVKVFDFVHSLEEIEGGACAFVSPVFSGSGAKIKIAEALMYGKKIIGTSESFNGYCFDELNAKKCQTAADFIKAINELDSAKFFYSENRDAFVKYYSEENNAKYYKQIVDFIKDDQ